MFLWVIKKQVELINADAKAKIIKDFILRTKKQIDIYVAHNFFTNNEIK